MDMSGLQSKFGIELCSLRVLRVKGLNCVRVLRRPNGLIKTVSLMDYGIVV